MTTADIATAAEAAVRADHLAGMLPTAIDRYEAAQMELLVRAEDQGLNLTPLVLKDIASKVAHRAVA